MNNDLANIAIDKNIPIPSRERGGTYAGLFRRMQVGDSVLLDRISTNWHAIAKQAGLKIATRGEDGDKVRIWRIA